jgi:hypothetical protein
MIYKTIEREREREREREAKCRMSVGVMEQTSNFTTFSKDSVSNCYATESY